MYTRSYDEKLGIVIPESYGGTLLREDPSGDAHEEQTIKEDDEKGKYNPWEKEDIHTEENKKSEPTFSFLQNLPFGNFFGDIFKKGSLSLQKIGTEEILIIATAAFLLFSKNGDKECAIMLLLLLFLT